MSRTSSDRRRRAGPAGQRRFDERNHPPKGEPWVWFTREMLESPAWRAMPLSARRVVDRIVIEHMAHGGSQNGELVVTYDDLQEWGVRLQSIAEAIAIAEALGFIDVPVRGRRAYGSARLPSEYGLTWLPRCDFTPASNRWKSVQSTEQATAIVDRVTAERREAERARRTTKRAANGTGPVQLLRAGLGPRSI